MNNQILPNLTAQRMGFHTKTVASHRWKSFSFICLLANTTIIQILGYHSLLKKGNILKLFILSLFLVIHTSSARAEIDWSAAIINAFETTGSDLDDIKRNALTYPSAKSWYTTSIVDVSAAGAGACGLPISGFAALPAEFLYLMRQIYNSTLGLGFIIYGDATKDDFATILGIWSEEISLDEQTIEKIYHSAEHVANEAVENIAEEAVEHTVNKAWNYMNEHHINNVGSVATVASNKSTGKAATKVISKLIARKTGAKVAGKLSTKVATKTGAKIGAKYAAKASTAWIPFVSAAVCGGLNAWIMNGIMASSEEYYTKLNDFRNTRYKN